MLSCLIFNLENIYPTGESKQKSAINPNSMCILPRAVPRIRLQPDADHIVLEWRLGWIHGLVWSCCRLAKVYRVLHHLLLSSCFSGGLYA